MASTFECTDIIIARNQDKIHVKPGNQCRNLFHLQFIIHIKQMTTITAHDLTIMVQILPYLANALMVLKASRNSGSSFGHYTPLSTRVQRSIARADDELPVIQTAS